ncbi:HPr family phosphocarrier protein [Caproicibacterium amylolyticum]|jgi:phosphotransferase system HPr (HPr) family protein|uniref:Phosphocarrier protein HPr n=1 Tax=Caproicibacterium amylolyticum TaxID=2766537 RepID=A0A7G9WHK8_9FIRM|nr:HPr family phosphocarrier protein [Caproicibacterium amylolyticum]
MSKGSVQKLKQFTYMIKAAEGLHARPAGLLVNCAKACTSTVQISADGSEADAKRLFSVMNLGISQNDTVIITITGPDEETDCEKLRAFCESNL